MVTQKIIFYILHICTKLAFINVDKSADEFSEKVVAATPHNTHPPIIFIEFCSILIQVKLDKPKIAGTDNLFGLSRFSFYQISQ